MSTHPVGRVATRRPLIPSGQSATAFVKDITTAVLVGCTGALPLLTIALHVFGLASMDTTAEVVVLPLWGMATVVMLCGRTRVICAAWSGLVGGLVAVSVYDLLRLPFVVFGGWPDFIPRVGGWVLGAADPNAAVGYLWRYLGDGGGLGVVFALLCLLAPGSGSRLAAGNGAGVWDMRLVRPDGRLADRTRRPGATVPAHPRAPSL